MSTMILLLSFIFILCSKWYENEIQEIVIFCSIRLYNICISNKIFGGIEFLVSNILIVWEYLF